jgi:hypothetical protein
MTSLTYKHGTKVIHNSNTKLRGTIDQVLDRYYTVIWGERKTPRFYRHKEIGPDSIIRPLIVDQFDDDLFIINTLDD